jgi:hypothetical protein
LAEGRREKREGRKEKRERIVTHVKCYISFIEVRNIANPVKRTAPAVVAIGRITLTIPKYALLFESTQLS